MARPKVDSRLQNIEKGILEIKDKLDKFPNFPDIHRPYADNSEEFDDE